MIARDGNSTDRAVTAMQLVPVLDLMNGQVVRGIAGQRDRYQPNQSCLVRSADPVATCGALVTDFSPEWMYVADLDGILRGDPQLTVLRELVRQPVRLAVDAGVATVEQARTLLDLGIRRVIIGLETLPDFDHLEVLASACGTDRIVFSVDLNEGRPIRTWPGLETPEHLVERAVAAGINQLVVLDLAGVGVYQGVTTSRLCGWIKHRHPTVGVWTGAGVRSLFDLQELASLHLDGVLVASALHEGRITPEDWRNFRLIDAAATSLWADE